MQSGDETVSEMPDQTSPEDLTSTANSGGYVIPLKPEPSYAVPADENTGPYEDLYVITCETNSPVYAELDSNKRETENGYQTLVKFA